jgi:CheY-like chemotaxis protein
LFGGSLLTPFDNRVRSAIFCWQVRPPGDNAVTERQARHPATAEEPTVSSSTTMNRCARRSEACFRSVSLKVETFGSGADFVRSNLPDAASCLVLDVRLPGLSGLDFQAELAKANINIPIIFMTGHGVRRLCLERRPVRAAISTLCPGPGRRGLRLAPQWNAENDRQVEPKQKPAESHLPLSPSYVSLDFGRNHGDAPIHATQVKTHATFG